MLVCMQGETDEVWTWSRGVSARQLPQSSNRSLGRHGVILSLKSYKMYIWSWVVGARAGKDVLEGSLKAFCSIAW